jgi:ELWxxDGT repeat protein
MSLPVCGAGNRLFLAATDGVSGLEPWISDGTAAGTYG